MDKNEALIERVGLHGIRLTAIGRMTLDNLLNEARAEAAGRAVRAVEKAIGLSTITLGEVAELEAATQVLIRSYHILSRTPTQGDSND